MRKRPRVPKSFKSRGRNTRLYKFNKFLSNFGLFNMKNHRNTEYGFSELNKIMRGK